MEAGTRPCPCPPSLSLLISYGGRAIRVRVASRVLRAAGRGGGHRLWTLHCTNQTLHQPACTHREME